MPPCPFDLVRDTPFGSYTASATKLTGGMINYVWRLTNALGDTIIVKYAEDSIAVNPEIKFSAERMDFEVRGLSLFNPPTNEALLTISELGKTLALTPLVRVPKLLYYDRSIPFLVLEDIGIHRGFEDWFTAEDSGAEDLDYVCAKVGEWLAHLHGFGYNNLGNLEEHFVNKPARELLSGLMYDMTAKDIERHTEFEDKKELADRIMQMKAELRQGKFGDSRTLLFGDMWPGSVLFDVERRVVNLLDFEFMDVGLIYGDIGHFVAHLLPLHFLRNKSYDPNTDPCPHSVVAFLSSYKKTMKSYPDAYRAVTKDAVRHSTVFMGIEITRDVLTGNWCRCSEKAEPKKEEPLTCECADILLKLARKYIYNPSDSLFNILN
ncbi:hypothetical protein GGI17_002182 [Coemansia sp. S146]|nr:hypothetical protein GGI17_002182 [Coemansia sp. S146]